jgi:hypothetical protein
VDDKLTIVVLTNLDAGHAQPGKIVHRVAGMYVPALAPVELNAIEEKEPQTAILVRDLLQEIVDGKADPDRFTPELRGKLFPETIQGVRDYLKELGVLKSLELIKRGQEGENRAYTYRANYERTELFLSVQLTKDNRMAVLDFSNE